MLSCLPQRSGVRDIVEVHLRWYRAHLTQSMVLSGRDGRAIQRGLTTEFGELNVPHAPDVSVVHGLEKVVRRWMVYGAFCTIICVTPQAIVRNPLADVSVGA